MGVGVCPLLSRYSLLLSMATSKLISTMAHLGFSYNGIAFCASVLLTQASNFVSSFCFPVLGGKLFVFHILCSIK